jgi:hypothetical protein
MASFNGFTLDIDDGRFLPKYTRPGPYSDVYIYLGCFISSKILSRWKLP